MSSTWPPSPTLRLPPGSASTRPPGRTTEGGGWDGITLAENLAAWRKYTFRPRVLVDVSAIDLSTTLLGAPVSMPIGVAPAALHGMAHADGELATSRAATAAGIANVVSTVASRTIEEVAAAAGTGLRWFQLYAQRDRSISRDFVQRAEAAAYRAIVLTVDLPVLGYRDDIVRIDFDPGTPPTATSPGGRGWAATSMLCSTCGASG